MKIKLGLLQLLLIMFLILKLTDNIDWSWWWVCSPLWIPLVVVIAALLLTIFNVDTKKKLK